MDEMLLGANCFVCPGCKLELKLPLPMSVKMFGLMARQFGKEHKNCKVQVRDA